MSGLLHLAKASDLDRLRPMVAAFHEQEGFDTSDEQRTAAIHPLLEGSPLGAIWLIGPQIAPVGYVVVSFGWSLELGGMDGFIDEIWIREKVRGRGMGSEALLALQKALSAAGVKALHLETTSDAAERVYKRAGFKRRRHALMTWYANRDTADL